MTNIVGNIGFSFTGKLGITLRGTIIDDSTTPDTVYLPNIERLFNITAGVITSASFPETETQNVSCRIAIYTLDGSSNPVLPPIDEFDAIIPNQASVEFSVLRPTGVVNNQLDTSALRIAKLIANDPALAQKVAGAPYPRGAYDNAETYLYGEMVSYFGKNYISKSLSPITGILPTNTTNWYELVITLPPEVSVIATGSDTAYGTGWNGSLLVPTQNAVYDKIITVDAAIATANTNITALGTSKADLTYVNAELTSDQVILDALRTGKADLSYVNAQLNTKANLNAPVFTGNPTLTASPSVTDNDTSIATTEHVRNFGNSRLAFNAFRGGQQGVPALGYVTTTTQFNAFTTRSGWGDSFGSNRWTVGQTGVYLVSVTARFLSVGGTPPTYFDTLLFVGLSASGVENFLVRSQTNYASFGYSLAFTGILTFTVGQTVFLNYQINAVGGGGYSVFLEDARFNAIQLS
ncbi:tail fiber protein [Nostoc phage N1]|nr:tail fiber protein [Nostoc phage N1]